MPVRSSSGAVFGPLRLSLALILSLPLSFLLSFPCSLFFNSLRGELTFSEPLEAVLGPSWSDLGGLGAIMQGQHVMVVIVWHAEYVAGVATDLLGYCKIQDA